VFGGNLKGRLTGRLHNGGADAFVHISAVERAGMREIVEGQKIGYDMERDMKSGKMSACNLQAA
jgi:CspA family cold shock protein